MIVKRVIPNYVKHHSESIDEKCTTTIYNAHLCRLEILTNPIDLKLVWLLEYRFIDDENPNVAFIGHTIDTKVARKVSPL